MKKLMTIAFAALVAGAASAAAIDWQACAQDSTYYTLPKSITTGEDAATVQVASVRTTVTLTDASTSGTLFHVGESLEAAKVNRGLRLVLDGGTLTAYLRRGNEDTDITIGAVAGASTTLAAGTHEIAAAIERWDESGINVAIFIDGVKIFELTNGNSDGGYWLMRANAGANILGEDAVGEVVVEDGVQLAANVGIEELEAYSAALPEPTALALLALGVAGLALRRRVA